MQALPATQHMLPQTPPQQDPLAQLRELHLPAAIESWPPALGWWLLAAIVVIAAVSALLLWRRHRRRTAFKREALAELAGLENGDDYLIKLNSLLKRTALVAATPTAATGDISQLSGAGWLQFLDAGLASDAEDFQHGPGQVLASGPYRPPSQLHDSDALQQLTARWIAQQRPPC